MSILAGMTSVTGGGSAPVRTVVGVATGTGGSYMCTGQLERRCTMNECGWFPSRSSMTRSTALPQIAIM